MGMRLNQFGYRELFKVWILLVVLVQMGSVVVGVSEISANLW